MNHVATMTSNSYVMIQYVTFRFDLCYYCRKAEGNDHHGYKCLIINATENVNFLMKSCIIITIMYHYCEVAIVVIMLNILGILRLLRYMYMGSLSCFLAIFLRKCNFCDFILFFPGRKKNTLPNRGLSLRVDLD